MASRARLSAPADREAITRLMREALGLPDGSIAIDPRFQDWKYWDPHPFMSGSRSYVIDGPADIAAHGCRWPIRLLSTMKVFDTYHLIDWAAKQSTPGSGARLLFESCGDADALFSIGGSAISRKLIPILGRSGRSPVLAYQVTGDMYFLARPLKPDAVIRRGPPFDWKAPARLTRDLIRCAIPSYQLPSGYAFENISPLEIAADLWPKPTFGSVVSARTPELLEHIKNCPAINRPTCFAISHKNKCIAYFFLAQVGAEVRLADYGPSAMNEEASRILGIAVQQAAKKYYPNGEWMKAATSEDTVKAGLRLAGLRQSARAEIRVLVANEALTSMHKCRLTLLDWDALCI